MKKLLSLLIIVFFSSSFYAQNHSIYQEFDELVGQNNTELSYGIVYQEKYRKKIKNNHNFYLDETFKNGSIIYRDELFNNIQIKYELVDDFIVIKLKNQDQLISIIPEKSLVKRFVIEGIPFINGGELGFLQELLVKEKFSVLKKHQKFSKENRDDDYRYHTFRKQEGYVLKYKNNFYQIDSKRDFVRIFPDHKKQISKLYKSNKYLLKNNYTTFVAKLITSLSQE